VTPAIQEYVLDKLRLSIGEAARVSGISVRQLSYWTQKGLVRALGTPAKKLYDFRALERIALIRHNLSEGYGLEEAAREADRLLRLRTAAIVEPEAVISQRVAELEQLVQYLKGRLSQATSKAQLMSTANKLSQLNLAALFDERPTARRRLVRPMPRRKSA